MKEAVTIFLLNGGTGHILESDDRTVLLRRENMTQLVYKHAISTLMPINSLVNYSGFSNVESTFAGTPALRKRSFT